MTLALYATDADSRVYDWHTVDWPRVNRYVRRLQARIVKAVITLPQSGRLDGCEQPRGLPMLKSGRFFKFCSSVHDKK